MTTLTREQVLQIIESAHSKGEMPKLFGADLAETELGRIDHTQAELHHTRLDRVELIQVDLSGVDFHGADLVGADQPGKPQRSRPSYGKSE